MLPSVRIVTPPAPIVTLKEAKDHLGVLISDFDIKIAALVRTAQATIEPPNSWVGAAFGVQTIEFRYRCLGGCLRLRFPPVREIVSVKYEDEDGVEQTLPAEDYRLVGRLSPKVVAAFGRTWPSGSQSEDSVVVRFNAGYDANDPELLPAKQALLLRMGDWFDVRAGVVVGMTASEVPMSETVKSLLWRYCVFD